MQNEIESTKNCLICQNEQQFQFKKKGYDYYRCGSCDLVSTYPLPDSATIEAHYAQAFQDGNYGLGQAYMKDYIRVYQDFVRRLEEKLHTCNLELSGLKILDIGCFTGELLVLLQKKGADVYGLELQSEAIKIANEKLPGRIFQADVFGNNFPQIQFNVVIMSGLIEHVVDPVKLLRRSAEVLTPGGILMLQTPNSTSWLSRMLGKYWPPYAPVEHIHLFSNTSLEKGLRDAGFENIIFQSHWKRLPIAYVYNNFKNFGSEFFNLLKPAYNLLPQFIRTKCLPFCIGEVIVVAQKPGK